MHLHAWKYLTLDAVGNAVLHQIHVLGALVFGPQAGNQKPGVLFVQMLELAFFFPSAMSCLSLISVQDWQADGNAVCL